MMRLIAAGFLLFAVVVSIATIKAKSLEQERSGHLIAITFALIGVGFAVLGLVP